MLRLARWCKPQMANAFNTSISMKEMSMTSQTGLQSTLVAAMLLPEQQRLQAGLPVTPWIVLTRTAQSFTTSERGVLQSDP